MKNHNSHATLAAALLIAVAIVYRIVLAPFGAQIEWLPNFAPTVAICLCGAIAFPRRWAVALPMAGLLVSDMALNHHYAVPLVDASMWLRYAAFALIACGGLMLRANPRVSYIFAATLAGSALFYLLTNTAAWLTHPGYVKSFAGWLQAHTSGLPGYPPTWLFFRNALAGDLLFTAVFLGCTGAFECQKGADQ